MKASDLRVGKRFHVVGVPARWEVLEVASMGVLVRPLESESRTFAAGDFDEVTISFRPRSFFISRETAVEVDG